MITYNYCTNGVINQPSLLILYNFVICGHISRQQESSHRVILDLSNEPYLQLRQKIKNGGNMDGTLYRERMGRLAVDSV